MKLEPLRFQRRCDADGWLRILNGLDFRRGADPATRGAAHLMIEDAASFSDDESSGCWTDSDAEVASGSDEAKHHASDGSDHCTNSTTTSLSGGRKGVGGQRPVPAAKYGDSGGAAGVCGGHCKTRHSTGGEHAGAIATTAAHTAAISEDWPSGDRNGGAHTTQPAAANQADCPSGDSKCDEATAAYDGNQEARIRASVRLAVRAAVLAACAPSTGDKESNSTACTGASTQMWASYPALPVDPAPAAALRRLADVDFTQPFESLALSNMRVEQADFGALADALVWNASLTTLDLQRAGVCNVGMALLAAALGAHPKLATLRLDHNKIEQASGA